MKKRYKKNDQQIPVWDIGFIELLKCFSSMCYNKNNEVLHLIAWAKTQPDFHSKPVEHNKEPIRFSLFVKSFRDVRGQRPSENYSSERRWYTSSAGDRRFMLYNIF